jgi:hypothetical protein
VDDPLQNVAPEKGRRFTIDAGPSHGNSVASPGPYRTVTQVGEVLRRAMDAPGRTFPQSLLLRAEEVIQ